MWSIAKKYPGCFQPGYHEMERAFREDGEELETGTEIKDKDIIGRKSIKLCLMTHI